MTLCYSYIRLSTDLQLTGDGLDRQMQMSREYAAKHDLILDETLRDLGVSGFTGENATRGALAQFLKRVESGLVPQGSVLIVESLDRLSRDKVTRAMSRFLALINAGITIVTLADNERRYDVETITADPTALMMSLLVMTRAHEESAVKSMRVRAAFERKRERAHKGEAILTAKCPSWLRLADDKKTWEVIEEKAKWVRLTFELAAEGMGMHGIVRYLNAQSAPPLAHGKGSHLSYIDSLLKERKVLGEVQFKLRTTCHKRIPRGDPVQNYYPAIVDPDLYMRVQAGLAQRKKGGWSQRGPLRQPVRKTVPVRRLWRHHDCYPVRKQPGKNLRTLFALQ